MSADPRFNTYKSVEGKKFDQGKPCVDLIPPAALLEEGYVWGAGKVKYTAYNWYNGIVYSRILAAVGRHWILLLAGIDRDPETLRHHAGAIRCGMGMIITFCLEGRTDLDDRIKMSDEAKRAVERMAAGENMFDILAGDKK